MRLFLLLQAWLACAAALRLPLSLPRRLSHSHSTTALPAAAVEPQTHATAKPRDKKYIVITGGVISGIGKGITASSIGVLLKMMGCRVTAIKIDPYLNVDAGTMSPFEHGETFVLDDGGETDLDLGNYERFLDIRLTSDSNLTTGKIYQAVIEKERRGHYLGKTVQIIPHVTNEIMERIVRVAHTPVEESYSGSGDGQGALTAEPEAAAADTATSTTPPAGAAAGVEPDVCVIELGGTIGDIESMPFVEALRQLQLKVGRDSFCLVHVSMVPVIGEGMEQKTKPTQHSVKELRGLGLTPDFIVCRAPRSIDQANREKIALFCNLPTQQVLSIPDVKNIYHVPLVMIEQGVHGMLKERLGLGSIVGVEGMGMEGNQGNIERLGGKSEGSAGVGVGTKYPPAAALAGSVFYNQWRRMALSFDDPTNVPVTVAVVGKYTTQSDAYLSVTSALKHAAAATGQTLSVVMIDSSSLEEEETREREGRDAREGAEGESERAGGAERAERRREAWKALKNADGILIPGGFGSRGMEGKISACTFARESGVPFLGICLGMQAAVIEYTRSVLGRPGANSREIAAACSEGDAAIVFMPEGSREVMGGTMRLGSRRTIISPDSLAHAVYRSAAAHERHRHRYEVNPSLVAALEAAGLRFSGRDDTGARMEIAELPPASHPYFLATQYHPELTSRPLRPAPVFLGLMQAIRARAQQRAFGISK